MITVSIMYPKQFLIENGYLIKFGDKIFHEFSAFMSDYAIKNDLVEYEVFIEDESVSFYKESDLSLASKVFFKHI